MISRLMMFTRQYLFGRSVTIHHHLTPLMKELIREINANKHRF